MLTPDSLVSVRLSKTNSLLIDDLDSVPGAKVELYENHKFLEFLTYRGGRWFSSTNTYPRESYNYTIKASAPGYKNVEGTDSIPQRATIQSSVKKSWFITEQNAEQEFVDYTASFIPLNKSGNYYELLFFTQYRQENAGSNKSLYNIYFIVGSILEADACIAKEKYLNGYFSTFVFSDENLDRQKGNLHLKFINSSAGGGAFTGALGYPWDRIGLKEEYTALRSVSKSYYLFRKSYYMYASNQELFQKWDPSDPFSVLINANPSDVFTNVKKGYGIVAAYQHSYVRTILLK